MSGVQKKRPAFTTTIDKDVADAFREVCKANGHKMSDVLEVFMVAYVDGSLSVESQTTFTLKSK